MKQCDKRAWTEAISDTAIGTLINFPLNIGLLSVTFAMEFTVFWTAVCSWFMFTSVAIVRKFFVRRYFDKRNS